MKYPASEAIYETAALGGGARRALRSFAYASREVRNQVHPVSEPTH
jgi:hypothetical protein